MASAPDFDLSVLSASQQEALQQYTDVTSQEIKDAVPILERSQWNVQVGQPTTPPRHLPIEMNFATDTRVADSDCQVLRRRGTRPGCRSYSRPERNPSNRRKAREPTRKPLRRRLYTAGTSGASDGACPTGGSATFYNIPTAVLRVATIRPV